MTNLEKLQNYALHGPYSNLKQWHPDITWGNEEEIAANYNAGQKAEGTGYSDFSKISSGDFSTMSDDEKMEWARKMSGDKDMTLEEMAKYLPTYDKRGETDLYTERAQKTRRHTEGIAGVGLAAETDLLSQAIAQDKSIQKGGFAATGNPMIDRQRENVYKGIDVEQDTRFGSLLDDVWASNVDIRKHREEFQQEWGERIISYEDKLEADLDKDEADAAADKKGTTFICGEIKKAGKMSFEDSLNMMKFLIKSCITHPLQAFWYITTGKLIIDVANKKELDWSDDKFKDMFVNDVLKLENKGRHNEAAQLYVDNCVELATTLGLSVIHPIIEDRVSLKDRIKGYFQILNYKPTWTVGIKYLKTLFKHRKLIFSKG